MSIAECEVVLKGDSGRSAGRRRRSKAEKVYQDRAEHRKAIYEALTSVKGSECTKADIREMIGFAVEIITFCLGGIVVSYLLM